MKYFFCLIALLTISSTSLALAESDDCKVLRGAQTGASTLKILSVSNKGYGDLDYWIRTFEINKRIANDLAFSLEIVAIHIQNKSYQLSIEQIIKSIKSAKQTGYGDRDYWASAVVQSARIYSAAGENLSSLKDFACAE